MKKRVLTLSLFMLILLLFSGCTEVNYNNEIKTDEDKQTNEPAEIIEPKEEIDDILIQIENMSLKEKIGQLLIVGLTGQALNDEIKSLINDYKIGGFIFFGRNISNADQTFKLINDIKKENVNNIPLFISIDEEGRVSRLSDEFHKLPAAKTIGDINDKDLSYTYGKIIADRLNVLGFNLNFAPVLDINSNSDNPVIGDRAFADNESVVSESGLSVALGIKENNIISVVKHFPGHGDTKVDSHVSLPIINKTRKKLNRLEIMPFKKAIAKKIDAVMVGHVLYNQIDENLPATMSKIIITDILRNNLSFDKVVFSDDMTMGAIIKNYSIEDASVKFLQAGGDVLLICHGNLNPKLVLESIKKAINDNVISEKEIDEKVYRILTLKKQYNLNNNILGDLNIDELNIETNDLLENIAKLK